MKTIIGLAIGIILAAAVIIPLGNARTQAELEAQRTQIALEAAQEEIEALKMATSTETSEKAEEVQEVSTFPLTTETTVEATNYPEPEKVEIQAETTSKPEVKQASSPQVASEQPKTWWENGKEYTMINGHKAEISSEGNNQLGYYDWENDPLKDVPGPFTGNGGN